MLDKDNKEITFTIKGKDYERLIKFKQKHADCLMKYPNMTAGQFQYSIMPDGLGVFKTCVCCCGQSISLCEDYNLGFDDEKKTEDEPKFRILTEDEQTKEIIKLLFAMEKRPRMFFGKNVTFTSLYSFLMGYGFAKRQKGEEEIHWLKYIDTEVGNKLESASDKLSEEEKFYKFFDVLRDVLKENYPQYL